MALLQRSQFILQIIGDGLNNTISIDLIPHYQSLPIPNFVTPSVLDVVDNYGISAGTFAQNSNMLNLTLTTTPSAGVIVNYTVHITY